VTDSTQATDQPAAPDNQELVWRESDLDAWLREFEAEIEDEAE
jgi:hypothetical protein